MKWYDYTFIVFMVLYLVIIYVLYNNIREKKNLYIKKHRGTSHKAASSPDLWWYCFRHIVLLTLLP